MRTRSCNLTLQAVKSVWKRLVVVRGTEATKEASPLSPSALS
jgi:hypothetical protein